MWLFGQCSSPHRGARRRPTPQDRSCFSIDEERTATELLSDTRAIISHTGDIAWFMPLISRSACKVNVADYPFDLQRCSLKFGSWTYNGAEMNLTQYANTAVLDKYESSGEWDVIDMPCVRNEVGTGRQRDGKETGNESSTDYRGLSADLKQTHSFGTNVAKLAYFKQNVIYDVPQW